MRFMLGQFAKGAAQRGSQRLRDLEQRAQVITDKYVDRYVTKFDEWNSNYEQDELAYNEAAQKLKQQGLDKKQIEAVLMGGLDGAESFIKALNNDMTLHRKAFEEKQNIASTVTTPTGFTIGARKEEYGGYTDEARNKFLQGMFIKVGDYDPAKADQYGKDISTQAKLYAQRRNPFTLDRDPDLAFQAEAAGTLSAIGIGIPEEYLKSSFSQQLSVAGIKDREKILGELGKNTGYQPVNLNYVPADTIIALQSHTMNTKIDEVTLLKMNNELKNDQDMNPLLKEKLIKEISLLDPQLQNIEFRNIALQTNNLKAKYELEDFVEYGRDNAKKISDLEVKYAEKRLIPSDTQGLLLDLNAQLEVLKKKPKSLKISQQIDQVNAQMQSVLTIDMTVQRNRAIANNEVTGYGSTEFIEKRVMTIVTDLRRQNGYVEGAIDRDQASPNFGKKLPGFYILQDGQAYGAETLEYQQIENQIRDEANYSVYKHAVNLETGELKEQFKNDIGMDFVIKTMKFEQGDGTRGTDIQAYLDHRLDLIQKFTKQEKTAVMMAIQANEPMDEVIEAIALDNQIDEGTATKYYNELNDQYLLQKDQTKKLEDATSKVPIQKDMSKVIQSGKSEFINDINSLLDNAEFSKAFQRVRTVMATGEGDMLGASPMARLFGYFTDKGTEISDRAKAVEAFRWWNSQEGEEFMYEEYKKDKSNFLAAARDPLAYYFNTIKPKTENK